MFCCQLSISPIFYEQLFHTEVFAQLLCAFNLGLKDLGAKAAHKMLVKLTPGGSMGPGYVMQIIISETSPMPKTKQPPKLEKSKDSILRILDILKVDFTKFKNKSNFTK